MGAELCDTEIEATSERELHAKFEDVITQAEFDHGHSGYSGSFAEKSEVTVVPRPEGRAFWTEDELREHPIAEDKWGPAVAGLVAENKYFVCGWCSS